MIEVYIQGKGRYRDKLRKALYKSDLIEGDHFIEGVNSLHEHKSTSLYWRTTRITLKQFKQAIGAKLIWKYRLRFYTHIDELPKQEKSSLEITQKDIDLMKNYSILTH